MHKTREAHSLAPTPPEERSSVVQHSALPLPKARGSFAPGNRRFRSLRLRAGGRPRRATVHRAAADRPTVRDTALTLCPGVRLSALDAREGS